MGNRHKDPKLTYRQVEKHRASIKIGHIIGRLTRHLDGDVEMSATQVRAAEILLRKALPDQSHMDVSQSPSEQLRELIEGMNQQVKARAVVIQPSEPEQAIDQPVH